jgi:ABC-type lipoprotein export system ATPase subunit
MPVFALSIALPLSGWPACPQIRSKFDAMSKVLESSSLMVTFSDQVSLHFPPLVLEAGEMVLLQGPSGAGKSTWMHAIAGLTPFHRGTVDIHGFATLYAGKKAPKQWRRSAVSLLPQKPFFWNSLSLSENLGLAAWAKGIDPPTMSLDALGLGTKGAQAAHSLSLGEQQRVNALRSFLGNAPVLLADEPTASLDDHNAAAVMALLRAHLEKQACGIVVSSHDHRLVPYMDRIVTIG